MKPLAARAFLLRATEPPALGLGAFVAEHGPVDAVDRIRAGAAPRLVLEEIRDPEPRIEDDLAAMDSGRIRLLTPEDPDWPHDAFQGLTEQGFGAPLGLWIRGNSNLTACPRSAVSIAGSPAATGYGEQVATTLGTDLAQAGVTVLASGAYGIAGAAHRGALAAEGTTIAFLACGLDIDYPAGHSSLLRVIAERGAVVSEYPPWYEAHPPPVHRPRTAVGGARRLHRRR